MRPHGPAPQTTSSSASGGPNQTESHVVTSAALGLDKPVLDAAAVVLLAQSAEDVFNR